MKKSDAPRLASNRMPPGYVEMPVRAALADRVVCTWVDATRADRHPVLPDACIDLVWDGTELTVAGPDTHAWPIEADATFVGIRFRPGAAPGLLGVPASELVDRATPLLDLWGRALAEEIADRLSVAGAAAPSLLEEVVAARFAQASTPDPIVHALIAELRRPGAGVQDAAERLGLSPRSLHRRATAALGYGPKTLERIIRFRRALRLVRSSRLGLAEAAYRAGYADQAHLTNEFRRLGGATPRALSSGGRLVRTASGF